MRYAIIGTGAIGGYYGGLLARAGRDVHFLLRSDYDHVKRNGLQVNSCDGSFHLDSLNVYNDTAAMPQCDVVFVCMKSTSNHQLGTMLPPLLHKDSIVVLIQNGIGLEPDLQAVMSDVQLAAGMAYICTIKTAPGVVDHLSNGRIAIADYSCRNGDALAAVLADVSAANVKAHGGNYLDTRWKKAVWNMPFNGLTALLGTDSGSLLKNPATCALVREMMGEVIAAAWACGATGVGDDYAESMMEMTRNMPPYASSMKFDRDHHRPMEIHYIYSRPIAEARSHGVDMPKLAMLEALLRFID